MRTIIEAVYGDMGDYVANNVIDWQRGDYDISFRDAASPNRTTFIPLAALKFYSIENVPDMTEKEAAVMDGRELPEEAQ